MLTVLEKVHAHIAAEAALIAELRMLQGDERHQAADLIARADTGRDAFISSSIYERAGKKENATVAVAQDYNWTNHQADAVLAAGRGFSHSSLGPAMEEYGIGLHEAAQMVREAENLKNGEHKLVQAAKVLGRGNFESKQHMQQAIRRNVKDKNKAAERARAKAAGLIPEFSFRAGEAGYKNLHLKNIPENDALVITDMVTNAIAALDEKQKRGTNAQVMGLAALHMLRTMGGGDYKDGRITTVFVVSDATASEAKIYNRKGQVISPEDFAEIKAQWGEEKKYVAIYDSHGRIVSVSDSRMATKVQRIVLLAEQGGCCFPDCEETDCQAHHMLPVRFGGATDTNNLVLLCPRHHQMVEKRIKDFMLDRERGISSWVTDEGSLHRGMGYHPHVPNMRNQARLFGIDLEGEDPERSWRKLRRILLREDS
ncbi:MAG: HNH endonuclease signature motif containing protein [Corynebacterium sp.]|nr:HNH endonuclease signature motif containing protein [Corynebacterium sp.]